MACWQSFPKGHQWGFSWFLCFHFVMGITLFLTKLCSTAMQCYKKLQTLKMLGLLQEIRQSDYSYWQGGRVCWETGYLQEKKKSVIYNMQLFPSCKYSCRWCFKLPVVVAYKIPVHFNLLQANRSHPHHTSEREEGHKLLVALVTVTYVGRE